MARSPELPISKVESWQMFDRIYKRYDFINRLLSFGLDADWRKRLADFLPPLPQIELLDLATGTGNVLLQLVPSVPAITKGFGMDLSAEMLGKARRKVQQQGLHHRIQIMEGDVHQIPFHENRFEAVTIAFGIRNAEDPEQVLKEMLRVLKPSGRALVLEFSLPRNALMRGIFLFYLRHILPHLGAFLSGDRNAYRYLNRTIEDFPFASKFCFMMKEAGFQNIKETPLTFGVATIYQGEKP